MNRGIIVDLPAYVREQAVLKTNGHRRREPGAWDVEMLVVANECGGDPPWEAEGRLRVMVGADNEVCIETMRPDLTYSLIVCRRTPATVKPLMRDVLAFLFGVSA